MIIRKDRNTEKQKFTINKICFPRATFVFYAMCSFSKWVIMDLDNYIFFVDIKKLCPFDKSFHSVPTSIYTSPSFWWPSDFCCSIFIGHECKVLQLLFPHYLSNEFQLSLLDFFCFHFTKDILFADEFRPWYFQNHLVDPHFSGLHLSLHLWWNCPYKRIDITKNVSKFLFLFYLLLTLFLILIRLLSIWNASFAFGSLQYALGFRCGIFYQKFYIEFPDIYISPLKTNFEFHL